MPEGPVGGGVDARRRGLLERTIGSVTPREPIERPLRPDTAEGLTVDDPVVADLTRQELRFDDEMSSFELGASFGASSVLLDEREYLYRWLTAAQSSGRMYC